MIDVETTPVDLATMIEQRRTALTVAELATIVTVSKRQIYNLIERGVIRSMKFGGMIRLDPVHVAGWLRSCTA